MRLVASCLGMLLLSVVAGCGDRSPASAPSAPAIPEPDLEPLWLQLGSQEASQVCEAMWTLEVLGPKAAAFLKGKLMPVPPDPARVCRLVSELDNDHYDVRERATHELEGLGEVVRDALAQALQGASSPESRERLGLLLARLDEGAAEWRRVNAIQVLGAIGTPEAREVLGALADGDPAVREALARVRR